jgi:hypothetical protein
LKSVAVSFSFHGKFAFFLDKFRALLRQLFFRLLSFLFRLREFLLQILVRGVQVLDRARTRLWQGKKMHLPNDKSKPNLIVGTWTNGKTGCKPTLGFRQLFLQFRILFFNRSDLLRLAYGYAALQGNVLMQLIMQCLLFL